MEIEEIRQLIQLMVENELTQMDIRDGESRILLKRGGQDAQVIASVPGSPPMMLPAAAPAAPAEPGPAAPAPPAEAGAAVQIKSPMVGTFYVAPAPDEPPYVNVGTHVNPDTVVCIIAAMKVMNEIKAECSGTITAALCKNEEAVEYDQPLFNVHPD